MAITQGSVAALLMKPSGGERWLLSLRQSAYSQASTELCTLPGVGPKVAACVCLFSLDKHEAVPVDTHVWQVMYNYNNCKDFWTYPVQWCKMMHKTLCFFERLFYSADSNPALHSRIGRSEPNNQANGES